MFISNAFIALSYLTTKLVDAPRSQSKQIPTVSTQEKTDTYSEQFDGLLQDERFIYNLDVTRISAEECSSLLDFTITIDQNRKKAESTSPQPILDCYTKKNSNPIDSLVEEAMENESLMSLLQAASLSPIETTQDMKSATYRLYESKGRGVADAYYALTSDDPQIVSKKLNHFWGKVGNKKLRNLDSNARYGGDNLPLAPQITDYAKTWLLFQQFLLNDLSEGNGVTTTAYRFGALNGNYDGLSLSNIPHISSSAGDYLFWAPSYMDRAVTKESGTLNVYRINSNYKGVDISKITDNTLNPDSRIGSNEIVFPAGSSFELTSTQTYSFGNKVIVSDIDIFNCETYCIANYILSTTLNFLQSDSPDLALQTISLLYKGYPEKWEIGDDIAGYFHDLHLPTFHFKDDYGNKKTKKLDKLKIFNIKAI
ncbi:hypothetical protein HOG98_01175 [bacterium]|jgi:hypothetical protein|nr:hypothetical protein [bacterium]